MVLLLCSGYANAAVLCPPSGSGGDALANRQKNRKENVDKPNPLSLQEIRALAIPPGIKRERDEWPPAVVKTVAEQERRLVVTEGYVIDVRREGPEAANCKLKEWTDYELWIADSPTATKSDAVVVEITPGIRALHSGWTLDTLQRFKAYRAKFRFTGRLFVDSAHLADSAQVRGAPLRVTLWEIHPITKIEVLDGAIWVVQ